jgi:hypothetical protein
VEARERAAAISDGEGRALAKRSSRVERRRQRIVGDEHSGAALFIIVTKITLSRY